MQSVKIYWLIIKIWKRSKVQVFVEQQQLAKIAFTKKLLGLFEKFVDLRQCSAVIPPYA
jgi:hypothetical protein